MMKIKKFFKDIIKNNYKLVIVYVVFLLMILIKTDYQIYSPGSLINLEDKIKINNSYESKGSFNLTYVRGRSGSILFVLASYLIPSWDLVPLDDVKIEDETIEESNERNKIYLNNVNENAIMVAFNELGMEYYAEENGVSVLHIYKNAETNLEVGDVIVSIDNIKIKNVDEFSDILKNLKTSQKINLKVINDEKEIERYAIIKNDNNKNIIGISIADERALVTNPKVEFKFKGNEIGPSGGLMTALKIYDMLNEEDITKGRIISGTGTISSTGEVGEISGVKYKLAGSVKKKADIFLCPSANYEECMYEKGKNNYKVKIIEADTFKNVLNKLND